MWAYIAFVAICILIFAVPMLIVFSVTEYKAWKLERAMFKASACKPWIGRDNRK